MSAYFILNGIETAMVDAMDGPPEWSGGKPYRTVTCPCGWRTSQSGGGIDFRDLDVPALRFHFTHCPRARGLYP